MHKLAFHRESHGFLDDDDHNIVDNTNSLVGNLTNQSAASVVYSYSGNA
jgi:hypothetical protein